jgi:hypothetical protein
MGAVPNVKRTCWTCGPVVAFLFGALLAAACGGSSTKPPTCPVGSETCPCYGNMTCNVGLACFSNICVNPATGNGGSIGGGGATGLAGSTGAGGTAGGAGTQGGIAGATGTGGTGVGTGGTGVGTGGTPGTGGSGAGTNLIKNGDFSAGKEYWDLTLQAGEVGAADYSGGTYCVYNESTNLYLSFSLGYPPTPSDAFAIDPSATYTLSYRARGTAVTMPVTIQVKIGHVEPPYTQLYATTDYPNAADQTFSHTVSSATGDTAAGLVFNGTLDYYSYVCFDDVKFIKN